MPANAEPYALLDYPSDSNCREMSSHQSVNITDFALFVQKIWLYVKNVLTLPRNGAKALFYPLIHANVSTSYELPKSQAKDYNSTIKLKFS